MRRGESEPPLPSPDSPSGQGVRLAGSMLKPAKKSEKRAKDRIESQQKQQFLTQGSPRSVEFQEAAIILKILSMIYKLVQSNTYATKRDIYYTDSQLFGNQTVVDNIINDISCMLKVPRRSLHILSTSKGLIAGDLKYLEEDGTKVNCTRATAVAVPSNIQGIQNLITDAKFLLIVEKDATFQRLLDDNFCNKMSPCIMVTGKGVPDLNTRLLVKKLWDTFHIPVFTLVDADPHGIEIMCIYKYGSMAMSFEAHNLTVPAIRWLGLLPSDIKRAKMSLFGTTSGFGSGGTSMFGSTTTDNHNPMKDIEVTSSPDDSIGCLSFSPPTLPGNFLIAGSWANDVRCWEVQDSGQTIPKAQQMHTGPVLDVCWSDDGSKVFTASCDKTAKMWDLNSNQAIQIAQHDAPVKTIHWIKAPNYSCVMTGSWDKTLKFWDTRSSNPMMVLQLPERCYCADVIYPMAVVATAERGLIVYQLENQPSEFRRIESPLKHQHRCVAIFKDKQNKPTGFALGSIEGRVAIHYINPPNPAKDNFTFKCHRSNGTNTSAPQDIYAVNGIAFHPVHGTLATVGSDGRFSFWDKDARTKLKTSEQLDQPISACCFNHNGNIFAYASSYDWSKGHEFYNPQKKNYIFLRNAAEELKPRNKK
ncbi:hypothetical protein JEQ12_004483 [Ovis aries]|uniref:DNA topoisomerase (ATP-hydrolyzing) n=14 Tax=Pecora TaxID=35500 RepID=A0A836CWL8_SHEEP|nr:hypothetical protein JEQ12_004483 [Ovis aries]